MLPAVGQGALGIEMRAGDDRAAQVSLIDDAHARAAVTAERALLAGLRAGCAAPVGALALCSGDIVELRAAVLSPDGARMYECVMSGSVHQPYDIGVNAATELIGQGAGELLGEK
jgi:hydroxymethylbilane synthase